MKSRQRRRIRGQRLIGFQRLQNELGQVAWFELATREHQNEVFRWPDVDSLASTSYGFKHSRIILSFHPPCITIAIVVDRTTNVSLRSGSNPGFRENLAVAPAPTLEKELTELRHI